MGIMIFSTTWVPLKLKLSLLFLCVWVSRKPPSLSLLTVVGESGLRKVIVSSSLNIKFF